VTVGNSQRQSFVSNLERTGRRLFDDLWSAGAGGASRFSRGLVACGRIAYISIEGFLQDLCLIRASALTFASLMGLVPILALTFSILRGLGWRGARLEELILGKATILSPDAIHTVVSYIDNTNFAGLGALGGSILFLTFVSVLTNIEGALNAIWGNLRPRPLLRRVLDYFGIMVIGPVLLAIATSLTAAVHSNAVLTWLDQQWGMGAIVDRLLGYTASAIVWILFALLYLFIPNTRVRFLPAAIGGVLAGSIWQVTQWGYIRFQIGMANYNAIYGALAQLPLLMAWVYVSWLIVLLGGEIACAVQNVGAYSRNRRARGASGQALREYAGLRIAGELAAAADGRKPAPEIADLAVALDVPIRLIRDIVDAFARAGIAHVTPGDDELCYLSLAPDAVTVSRVIEVLRGELPGGYASGSHAQDERVHELLDLAEGARSDALRSRTLRDLSQP